MAEGSGSESWASSPGNRKSMQGNRSRDTKPELAVRSAVHRRGIRFRVSARPQPELPRTADLVLRKSRIAVFVDGCYWHGCPEHRTQPSTNAQYWADKIARNIERDAETTDYLQRTGWTVLRFWEHENPESVADRVEQSVRAAPRKDTNRGATSS
ncbi:MAG: very short patch repair endonuclease [Acidimicrobiaceae bacterium]|nr:very short patch repair endonuclease [Acidimicrobiaceae bacterium]